MRILGWIAVALLTLAVAATLDPARIGGAGVNLSTVNGATQFIALRPWLVLGFVVAAILTGLLAAGVHRWRGGAPRLISAVVIFALAAVGHGAVLASRGLSAGEVPVAATEAADEITILNLNVRGGASDTAELVALVREAGVDVLVLPESGADVLEEIAAELAAEGQRFEVFAGTRGLSQPDGTGILVSERMGEYEEIASTERSVLRIVPVNGDGPPITAVHPRSPPGIRTAIARPQALQNWRDEVSAVAPLCAQTPGGIVAGDFNATLDHASMRPLAPCVDASVLAGIGGMATYPVRMPALLGTTIDHVLIDPADFEVTAGAVVEVSGTDHRGVLIRLAPAG
ncbi:endonuclease/exonuclease/phosphatase family protein [Occultella gossypii]|uniref:Endonuclease/exonuclease/phosphatase family protein n=1 Tax=Occultella gossypii TaxID=2800820 RepID=A0ABS7SHA0_9MICO|nr:endonuclease/exonuclease/phosphatase family protein [Occultella gossypii]MBZ2199437.1 endonuclease/exonuclease/phosphatase family protein [Occultella gossypii]